jgi:hypothetical protein
MGRVDANRSRSTERTGRASSLRETGKWTKIAPTGSVKQAVGGTKQAVGKAAGDKKLEAEGVA